MSVVVGGEVPRVPLTSQRDSSGRPVDSVQRSLDVTGRLAMEGGKGESSYGKNSRVQAQGVRFVRPVLEEAIQIMTLPAGLTPVKIADFGCSSGPNSASHMSLIVNTLKKRYQPRGSRDFGPQEFHVYFVDLPSNDFDSLLRVVAENEGFGNFRSQGAPEYFSTVMAGTFYGRLLPPRCLDVAFSSFALHWLSKIPDEVQQPHSGAYNDGFVWIHRGKPEVGRAYAVQAKADMIAFLRARAEEMVPGSLMFLMLKGRKQAEPTRQYDSTGTSMFGVHMEEIFNELVSKGKLDVQCRDSFNVPIYYRTVDEMREAIGEVSEFTLTKLELLDDVPGNTSTQAELRASPTDCGKRVAKMCRCLLGVLIESHMGLEVANEFFERLEERAILRSKDEAREQRVVRLDVNLAVLIRN